MKLKLNRDESGIGLVLFIVLIVVFVGFLGGVAYVSKKMLNKAQSIEQNVNNRLTNDLVNVPGGATMSVEEILRHVPGASVTTADGIFTLTIPDEEAEEILESVGLWRVERADSVGGPWEDTGAAIVTDLFSVSEFLREMRDLEMALRTNNSGFFRARKDDQ